MDSIPQRAGPTILAATCALAAALSSHPLKPPTPR